MELLNSTTIVRELVNSDRLVREKAHSNMISWLALKYSTKNILSYQSMLKIWRGLLRSLWMTDTFERQEVLTDILSKSIVKELGGPSSDFVFIYGAAFWNSIAFEWELLDQFRLDKFYLLMRKLGPITIHPIATFISEGRKDGKKTPDSIILFIVDNFLDFTQNIKFATCKAEDILTPLVRLFLTTKNNVTASRINENIFIPLCSKTNPHPFVAILPDICQGVAKSDIEGFVFFFYF